MAQEPARIGPYQVVRFLGRGGMAAVYLGRAPDGREVAVKVVRAELATDAEFLERFGRECRTTRALRHEGIVRILDHGVDEGAPWYAMEYLPHPTLAEVLVLRGRLPEPELVTLARRLLGAMAAYERRGIVHRDLTPTNVLVRPDGRPVLVDFGLAHSPALVALTLTGDVIGTPGYLAPEMVRGHRVDLRSDLYQLGLLLYECRAGRLPFDATKPTELAEQVALGQRRPLRELAPDTSEAFAAFVDRCMALDPADRFPDTRAARRALAPLPPPDEEAARDLRRALLLAAASLLLLALAVVVAWRGGT